MRIAPRQAITGSIVILAGTCCSRIVIKRVPKSNRRAFLLVSSTKIIHQAQSSSAADRMQMSLISIRKTRQSKKKSVSGCSLVSIPRFEARRDMLWRSKKTKVRWIPQLTGSGAGGRSANEQQKGLLSGDLLLHAWLMQVMRSISKKTKTMVQHKESWGCDENRDMETVVSSTCHEPFSDERHVGIHFDIQGFDIWPDHPIGIFPSYTPPPLAFHVGGCPLRNGTTQG